MNARFQLSRNVWSLCGSKMRPVRGEKAPPYVSDQS